MLGLPTATVKLGIMDEERRTSVNLKACIAAAADRVAFINTGFLDRTGDEMHTAMLAGPMLRKGRHETSAWIQAYERNNVLVGLACGLRGKAQIGKGMWAMPDLMKAMLEAEDRATQGRRQHRLGAQPHRPPRCTRCTTTRSTSSGAEVAGEGRRERRARGLLGLLTIPVVAEAQVGDAEKQQELDNNAQGILGYVVRWVDQGVGCSKVPDIHNVGLMEDRATLRISSQHICQLAAPRRGEQGAGARPPSSAWPRWWTGRTRATRLPAHGRRCRYQSAYQAALRSRLQSVEQPSGYTEPLLHAARLVVKTATAPNDGGSGHRDDGRSGESRGSRHPGHVLQEVFAGRRPAGSLG